MRTRIIPMLCCLLLAAAVTQAAENPPAAQPAYDASLAARLGADEYGMRNYVLVILKTGPKTMPAGPQRDTMFRGHMANIQRLAAEGKLALAGPLDGVDAWRGLFILAVADIEAARQLVATDPVVINGEMVAEYHKYYGSAALMQVNDSHARLQRKPL